MNSRQTSKLNNRFFILVAIFIVAVLSWRFFPAPGTYLGNIFIEPLLRGETIVNTLTRGEPSELSDDELAELAVLRTENESLRFLAEGAEEELITAGVIGRPTALPYDVIMIDRGSTDGVLMNAPVYAAEGVAIGYVISVHGNSALVALVSTPGHVSTVYIYGPNIYTTAVGIGGGVTRIHVPQGVPLSAGDAVIMPSLSQGIYGSVTAVDSVPERPEQYGYMTSEFPISSLRFVFVGKRAVAPISFDEAKAVVEATKQDILWVDVPEGLLIDIGNSTSTATTSEDIATTTEEVTESEE